MMSGGFYSDISKETLQKTGYRLPSFTILQFSNGRQMLQFSGGVIPHNYYNSFIESNGPIIAKFKVYINK